ncbi:DUF3352 domain-containing protein [Tannerella forsythia]|uniref:DUF3352 domain-containing protein n=2 Tax=Tannerella forsythia TaxID=28112 RepID=A0A3P1YRE9_TANFO|nr:DUF3352 domain-containing protein [Tannerella forsythia]
MISVHRMRHGKLGFLYVLDLQKISEVQALKEQIDKLYAWMNYGVTYRKYKDTEIVELRDPKTRDMLYTAFVDNHYIASATAGLIEASISERNEPIIGLDPLFIEADQSTDDDGVCRIFVQHATLPRFLDLYMGKRKGYLPAIGASMAYTGLSLQADKEKFALKGYTFLKDTVSPYIATLLHSEGREITAHKILSDRTAFYTNICVDDPLTFVEEMETMLSNDEPSLYATYKESYERIENMFDISLRDDFLSWMAGEFAVTELEPGLLGHDTEMLLAVRAEDLGRAQEKMAYIEKQVKKNTPVHIRKANYKGYEINYVELKGFFALFFGKMFEKFEKPYYTYVNDFVVFSNKPATLLSFIEDYEQERTLRNDNGFKQVLSQIDDRSTYFVYTNSIKFLPLMEPLLNQKTWESWSANREMVYSFPYSALQIVGNRQKVALRMVMNYHPYRPPVMSEEELREEDDTEISEKAAIDELNRFYAEKFQGNIYREFYPEGALKSECEIRNGQRHGKYHEYFENGSLKIRGRYDQDHPTGTWKYYTEDGTLEKKVRL